RSGTHRNGPWSGVPARLPGHVTSQVLPNQTPRIRSQAGGVRRHAVRFPPPRVYEEVAGVLRITWLSEKGRGLTLKAEGEIVGPWVGSVRDACVTRGRRRPRLDLAAVTYGCGGCSIAPRPDGRGRRNRRLVELRPRVVAPAILVDGRRPRPGARRPRRPI